MKKIFYFLFITLKIITNYKIEPVFEWNSKSNFSFEEKNSFENDSIFNYFPSHIGMDKNNTIYVSFPTDYFGEKLNPPFKFAYLENNNFKQFSAFEDDDNECENKTNLCNLVSFEIDENDNFYFLDQGDGINNSTKIIIYNKKETKFIYLNISNENRDYYLNFVVDSKNEIIYIIHGYFKSIYNLEFYVVQNIHDDNPIISQIKDNYIWSSIKNFEKNLEIKNLGLSCDYKYLFISSLNLNFIYSIKVEDIFKCIEKNTLITQDIVEENNIKEPTNSIILSSKGNLYIGGKNSNQIYVAYYIKNKLSDLNSNNLEKISFENDEIKNNNSYKIINSMFIHNKYLYFLENNFGAIVEKLDENETENNNISYYGIYKINLKKDDSIKEGCQYIKFKNDKKVIIFWINSFLFIIFILIILFIGSRKKDEIANSYLKLIDSEKISMVTLNNTSLKN